MSRVVSYIYMLYIYIDMLYIYVVYVIYMLYIYTLPETNGLETTFLLGFGLCSGAMLVLGRVY